MIEFPPPNFRALCPLIVQIAQMDFIFPRCGLILPRIPGICMYTIWAKCLKSGQNFSRSKQFLFIHLYILPALLCTAPNVCCRSSAAWSPLSSSQAAALGLAVSWLQRRGDDYFGWVKHFPSLKQIWSWIRNNLRLMNSTMISYVNSFPRIQPWFHYILHSTEFTHEFMIMILFFMNSYDFMIFIIMNSLAWIQR